MSTPSTSTNTDNRSHTPMCSFCYTPLQAPLRCGGCNKHPYCSKECQRQDWKQHKIWCGRVAEIGVDFELRDAGAGKGLGYFALRDFAVGEKVLVERPAIHIPLHQTGYLDFKIIESKIAGLPAGAQAAVLALHCDTPEEIADALSKPFVSSRFTQQQLLYLSLFSTNSNSLGPDGQMGMAVFIHGSRFNHACIPNCIRFWVKEHDQMVFSTRKSIAAGTEMTISYSVEEPFMKSKAECRDYSMKTWGFCCSCPACSDPAFFQKCAAIRNIKDSIDVFKGLELIKHVDRIMEMRKQVCMLMDEIDPGFYPELKADLYSWQFLNAVMKRSTLKFASYCAEKNLEIWEQMIGGSTIEPEEISKARLMVEHPEREKSYLLLERKRNGRGQTKTSKK